MKATATTLITGILLLTAAGCSSSGSISGSGGAKNSPGGAGTKTGVSAPEGAAPSGGGDNHVATPKTAVEAFMNAVKKGDMAAVAAATCQDMKDEVANNLNGLTLQSFSAEAPYQMEDHWVVSTTFSDTQNGAPFQGKVDYQVVKDGDTYKWCGLDVPFGAPKGTPGIDPSQTKS
ncbi:MAG: hypothetical protein HOW97_28405 [Catenulispora sp.]|nr:hypothetical protein [Catenulispora sp.]